MKFCKDCANFRESTNRSGSRFACLAQVRTTVSPVTGATSIKGVTPCELARIGGPCGPDGLLYTEKGKSFVAEKVSFWGSCSMV